MPSTQESVSDHDRVMFWMAKKAPDGHLRMNQERVVYYIGRRILNSGHGESRARNLLTDLEDEGRIYRRDDGTYEIERLDQAPCAPWRALATVTYGTEGAVAEKNRVGSDGGGAEAKANAIATAQGDPIGVQYAPIPRLRTPPVVLAREYFPRVCHDRGIVLLPAQHCWPAMAKCFRDWNGRYATSWDEIKMMIEEFGRHPQWARRSRRTAWQVMLSRRAELTGLIAKYQKQQDRLCHRLDASWWLT